MSTDCRLQVVADAARAQGLGVEFEHGRLVFYPQFKGALEGYSGDIAVQVEPTLLGLRFDVYETCCGTILSPGGAHEISDWLLDHLGRGASDAYWWTYRRIWGWLHSHRWVGLKEACSVAHRCAHDQHWLRAQLQAVQLEADA